MLARMVSVVDDGGWAGFGWRSWTDLAAVRERLEQGADPNVAVRYFGPPLHLAAESGSAEVVAELARRVDDVDALSSGRTALWRAVAANRADNARVLAAAGADPWRQMMSGWSPGRLSLAGPTPELFGPPKASLAPEETAVVEESRRLLAVLGGRYVDGLGIACVAGIDVAEAVRRLDAGVVDGDMEQMTAAWEADPGSNDVIHTMWVTEVPGGCVLAQPWGYGPNLSGVSTALSVGTTCYSMYANPKSGNQGSLARDGRMLGWDLHPGGGSDEHDEGAKVLLDYLYRGEALAYCFAYAGLRPTDDRAISGPPDVWIRLPDRDHGN
jgi:ankyrin repeat protein